MTKTCIMTFVAQQLPKFLVSGSSCKMHSSSVIPTVTRQKFFHGPQVAKPCCNGSRYKKVEIHCIRIFVLFLRKHDGIQYDIQSTKKNRKKEMVVFGFLVLFEKPAIP